MRMSIIEKTKNFFRLQRAEILRISWPTRKELVSHSVLILTVSLALAILFAVFDIGFDQLIKFLLTKVL